MNAHWLALEQEVAQWRGLGRPVNLWWRDDDARTPSAELARLLDLARDTGVPLALAVIPHGARAEAFDGMPHLVEVLQHGADHLNRGSAQGKKTEFPLSEPAEEAIQRLLEGRRQLKQLFGERALAVLAPPWNRFAQARVGDLARAGYIGLSSFQPRQARELAPGLLQINTHVDIIDWRAGRVFVGEDSAVHMMAAQLSARRLGQCDADEPLGLLTHHAVHDRAAWEFLQRLFERSQALAGLRWRRASEIFTP